MRVGWSQPLPRIQFVSGWRPEKQGRHMAGQHVVLYVRRACSTWTVLRCVATAEWTFPLYHRSWLVERENSGAVRREPNDCGCDSHVLGGTDIHVVLNHLQKRLKVSSKDPLLLGCSHLLQVRVSIKLFPSFRDHL